MATHRERGAVLPLVAVSMLALIAIAGLAIDTSHVLLNKARLQSAVDAAALAAAKVLDQTGSTTQADISANSVLTANLAQYPELQNAMGAGLTLTTQYSSTLNPFSPGTTPAMFVQASITGFPTTMSLSQVLGITSINVGGSAVAGPSQTILQACNVMPIMMCASGAAPPPLFGYLMNQVLGLDKVPSSGASGLAPGNYNLLDLGGGVVQTNLAGSYNSCATIGQPVLTNSGMEPVPGPVEYGVNTRFNQYQAGLSPIDYPPDVINSPANQTALTGDTAGGVLQGGAPVTDASQLTFNWSNYTALLPSGPYDTPPIPAGPGAFRRREVAVPMGDCSTAPNGTGGVNVLGFACLFLLQAMSTAGQETLYAQVISTCDAEGQPGAGAGPGPHVIELYKSAGSPDS
jgi:Flp pilus assembly protein TadG